jgi:hypothetical protein
MRTLTALLPATLFLLTTAQAQSVQAPWDIAKLSQNLATQAGRLDPLLAQLTPQAWQAKGAPAVYVTQVRNARDEIKYLIGSANNLTRQPEKLSVAFETYFRMQSVESQVASLVEGVRRYQNPAVGELILSVMSANQGNRDQLRDYITDLAKTREAEFKIADSEAQRCRTNLLRQPAASPAPSRAPAPAK